MSVVPWSRWSAVGSQMAISRNSTKWRKLCAALCASALAVPQLARDHPSLAWLPWLYLLLPIVLCCLHPKVLTAAVRWGFKLLRRPRPDHPVSGKTVFVSLAWALGSYISYGTHMWLLARSSADVGLEGWGQLTGVMAASMIVSLIAFFLPSGAGARELVIVAALSPMVGPGAAAAYAAVSRLLFTIADLGTAGLAALTAVVAKRKLGHYHGDPGID